MSNNFEYVRLSEIFTPSVLDAFHRAAGYRDRDHLDSYRITEILDPNPCKTED